MKAYKNVALLLIKGILILIVGYILYHYFGRIMVLVYFIAFIIFLMRLHAHSLTTGLSKSCLTVYNAGRSNGLNHEEALNRVIDVRYSPRLFDSYQRNYKIDLAIQYYKSLSKFSGNLYVREPVKNDLCFLLCAFSLVDMDAPLPFDGKVPNIFLKRFNQVYLKESKKFEWLR